MKRTGKNLKGIKKVAFSVFGAFALAILALPLKQVNADTTTIEYSAYYDLKKSQASAGLYLPSEKSHKQELKVVSKSAYKNGKGKTLWKGITSGPYDTTGVSHVYFSPSGLSFQHGYAKFYINGKKVKQIERSL